MSTKKQIAANRSNALESPGPGPAGKSNSSLNATKHCLFCKHLRVREEDRDYFLQFTKQIYAEFLPKGPTETFFVEHLIDQCWRLAACLKLETDLFEHYRQYTGVKGDVGTAFAHDASQTSSLTRLSCYASRFQRGLRQDLAELRKLQARPGRASAQAPLPAPVDPIVCDVGHNSVAHSSQISCTGSIAGLQSAVLSPKPAPPAECYLAPLGILTRQVLLSDEDPIEFKAYVDSLFAEWKPKRATQALFVEFFAVDSLRLERLSRVEAGLLEQYRFNDKVDGGLLTAFVRDATEMDCFSILASCETRLRNGVSRILKELLS